MTAKEFFKHMTGIRVKSEYRIGTDGCVELMEQYAKEQAVEFVRNISVNDLKSIIWGTSTADKLYDQFKQQ